MDNLETERIENVLIDNAKFNFEYRQWLGEWEKINNMLDNPMLIETKAQCLAVWEAIIQNGLDKGSFSFGSVIHKLGMRVADFIMRSCNDMPEKE